MADEVAVLERRVEAVVDPLGVGATRGPPFSVTELAVMEVDTVPPLRRALCFLFGTGLTSFSSSLIVKSTN